MRAGAFLCLCLWVVACGGDPPVAPDTGVPDDAGMVEETGDTDAGDPDTGVPFPAPFPAPPQVITAGGPTAANGKVVLVVWSNDALQSQIEQYLKAMSPSAYWSATTKEYKVGDFAIPPTVVVTDPPFQTIDDQGIQAFIAQHADGSDMAWPKADSDTVFLMAFPGETQIQLGNSVLCNGVGGYHENATLADNTPFSYAVVPRCNGIDSFTATASHELVEWATDPYPFGNAAYTRVDTAHLYWDFGVGSETGDMCELYNGAYQRILGSFYVQRTWSNAAMKAGKDPCVPPLANSIWFAAAPESPDTVQYTYNGQKVNVKGVKVPVGTSKTIPVHLYSEAPTPAPWTVTANVSQSAAGSVTFALDKNTGQNGDILQLTITAVKATSSGAARFTVQSINKQNVRHSWYGLVGF